MFTHLSIHTLHILHKPAIYFQGCDRQIFCFDPSTHRKERCREASPYPSSHSSSSCTPWVRSVRVCPVHHHCVITRHGTELSGFALYCVNKLLFYLNIFMDYTEQHMHGHATFHSQRKAAVALPRGMGGSGPPPPPPPSPPPTSVQTPLGISANPLKNVLHMRDLMHVYCNFYFSPGNKHGSDPLLFWGWRRH